jgi:hypothetical protein
LSVSLFSKKTPLHYLLHADMESTFADIVLFTQRIP